MNNVACECSVRASREILASQGGTVVVPLATSYHWPESVDLTDFVEAQERV